MGSITREESGRINICIAEALQAGKSRKEIAETLGRSEKEIGRRMRLMGMNAPRNHAIDVCLNCTMPQEYCDHVCSEKNLGRATRG